MMMLFTVEGILITLVNNLINNNNNLLASRMGASDYEISLVITLPQLVGMLVLIPGGILTDRMTSKRKMVVAALACLIFTYALLGFVPMLGVHRLKAFLVLLAVSLGPMTIYTVSWQAYFSDVVDIETRNSILTARTGFTFLIGTIITLCSGALLSSAGTNERKIIMHQIFFWIAGVILLLQIFVLKKIKSSQEQNPSIIRLRELKTTFRELKQNKKFLNFICVAIFFYITWHIDWTLYYLGQVDYLGLNEAWLSYVNIGGAIMQFLTIGFWSRLNYKRGVRFAIIFGSVGLTLAPLAMIIATSASVHSSKVLFLIFSIITNFDGNNNA
jgi:Na+/melibiose symporter-like transporter